MAHRKIVSSERRAIGKKLREARERRVWSQLYLATKLETNQTTVSRWEKGVTLPSYFFREKLCSLLGVSMEVFGGLVEVEESEFQEEERPSLLNPENEVTDLSPPEASDAREQNNSSM